MRYKALVFSGSVHARWLRCVIVCQLFIEAVEFRAILIRSAMPALKLPRIISGSRALLPHLQSNFSSEENIK